MDVALWWIKRDIRLSDNEAFTRACKEQQNVLPVYVFEPSLWSGPDSSMLHFHAVTQALQELRLALRRRGSEILLLTGEVPAVFRNLGTGSDGAGTMDGLRISAVYAYEETGIRDVGLRNERARSFFRERGIPFIELPRNGVVRGLADRDQRIRIWHQRMEADPFVAPEHPAPAPELRRRAAESGIPHPAELVTGDTGNTPALPATPGSDGRSLQRVSEAAAEITLNSFLQVRASRYSGGMSSMNLAPYACSRLSVHLAWGTISMRQAYHALSRRLADANLPPAFRKGLRSFRSRLFWHDHFIQRLEDEPEMEFHPLNRAFEDAPFKPNGTLLEAWYRGRTGFPFVDAGMRCLAATGYLNFRMRAMLMSAATHGLGLPWQDVLYPMARLMADYLPGIHISQSQMQAGVVGINTIRIYNPQKQLKDHDPECRFTKKWLPELRGLPPEKIAAEEIPRGDAETAYPEPVVNYREQVAAMRRALWSIKGSPEGRAEAERVLEKHGSRKGGGARRRRS